MNHRHVGLALAHALSMGMFPITNHQRLADELSVLPDLPRLRKGSKTYKPNGARECARRRRQIAAGTLNEENGLVRQRT